MVSDDGAAPLVLVVDDDPDVRRLVQLFLEGDGYATETFGDAESCLAGLGRLLPDAICLDLNLPGLGGIETLARIKALEPRLPVIILTATAQVDTVVTAMQRGAYDYVVKPFERSKLLTTVRNAVERSRMAARLVALEREARGEGYPGIIGQTAVMKDLFRQLDRVAASDITALIFGESGTGKELVARAIHEHSGRGGGPFVALNCAAIPDTLQESELFGHERGAFTGAHERRVGLFEQAHRGTLLLDEVGELSQSLQAKLLRVLQERSFHRLGGSLDIKSDFRLIAATHRRLIDEVEAGRFREDLFFRIAVFEIDVPPLRERRDDIPLLVHAFLRMHAGPQARVPDVTLDAMHALLRYHWPGNVRELSNAVHRAMVEATGRDIERADLPQRVRDGHPLAVPAARPAHLPSPATLSLQAVEPAADTPAGEAAGSSDADVGIEKLDSVERAAIERTMRHHGGNLSAVARDLGIGRTTLYRKLKLYGLR